MPPPLNPSIWVLFPVKTKKGGVFVSKFTLITLLAFFSFMATGKGTQKTRALKNFGTPKELVSFKERFDFKIAKTGRNEFKTVVKNLSQKEQKIRLKARELERYPFDLSKISLPQGIVTLAPGGETEISYRVEVPADSPGSGGFRLYYDLIRSDNTPAMLSDGIVAFNVSDRVGHRFKLEPQVSFKRGMPFIKTRVQNDGDGILYGIKLDLVVMNSDNQKIASKTINSHFDLAGKGRHLVKEAVIHAKIPKGKYRLLAILSSHNDPSIRVVKEAEFKR